jgi:hypothetical protein
MQDMFPGACGPDKAFLLGLEKAVDCIVGKFSTLYRKRAVACPQMTHERYVSLDAGSTIVLQDGYKQT